jgi:hypothetical protein
MPRDIDYAAIAVKNSIVEKFGRQNDLSTLEVMAGQHEILISDGVHSIEGSRDKLLAAIRAAQTYADLWHSPSKR